MKAPRLVVCPICSTAYSIFYLKSTCEANYTLKEQFLEFR